MRRQHGLFISVLILNVTLSACGGGGSSSGSVPVTASVPAATGAPGVVAAAGSLTMLGKAPVIGSTILPASQVAILTLVSGATPGQIVAGGSLRTYPIVISETAGMSTSALSRSLRLRSAVRTREDRDVRIPDVAQTERATKQLLELQQRTGHALRISAARPAGTGFIAGDRHTFQLSGGTIDGTVANPAPISMPATLVGQSAHANVWLDDAVYRNPAVMSQEYPSGDGDFITVASDFEQTFAIETQAFGPAYTTGIVNFAQCNANGSPLADAGPRPDTTGSTDPHINIVITDQLKGSGEGGYFYGLDMLDQAEANCVTGLPKPVVNGLPMLVIGSDSYAAYSGDAADTYPANNEAYWLQGDMPQTIAHEFQHYLHFVNKYLQQHVDHPDDASAGTLDDSFIDEGCSVLAQDLVAGSALDRRESPAFVRAFLLDPSDFSLTAFSGFVPDASASNPTYGFHRNTAGNYGLAYLFVRYLYDRFGAGALKAIYAETNFNRSLEPDTGPATAAAGGESFARLAREFATAVAVHSGGSVPALASDPAYRFDSSVILRGTVLTYSRRLAPYNVRTIVQPGPLNPQTFINGIPAAPAALAAGDSVNATLIEGGALYLTPNGPWPQGAVLRAAGPAMNGGSLGQGALPTPAPAYN